MHLELLKALDEAVPVVDQTPGGIVAHDVQFYRTDGYLIRAVADFLAAGLEAGQPAVVIATEPHRRAFLTELQSRGLHTEDVFSGHEAHWLDARDTLDCFMEGRHPNRELFMATVGNVFERVLRKRNYLVVRGYGEMVDLLWRDGNTDGAIVLEALWNELAAKYSFSLLCGYSLENFLHESGAQALRRVCAHHTGALPMEGTA